MHSRQNSINCGTLTPGLKTTTLARIEAAPAPRGKGRRATDCVAALGGCGSFPWTVPWFCTGQTPQAYPDRTHQENPSRALHQVPPSRWVAAALAACIADHVYNKIVCQLLFNSRRQLAPQCPDLIVNHFATSRNQYVLPPARSTGLRYEHCRTTPIHPCGRGPRHNGRYLPGLAVRVLAREGELAAEQLVVGVGGDEGLHEDRTAAPPQPH